MTQVHHHQPQPMAMPPAARRTRPTGLAALVLAVIATVLAAAALIVVLTRGGGNTATPSVNASPPPPPPTYTAVETTQAQQELCDTYRLAARSVQIETHGSDQALARIASTNAAAMLDDAAAVPALDTNARDAAHALATAYRTAVAKSSTVPPADPEWQATVNDVNAKDGVMRGVCK